MDNSFKDLLITGSTGILQQELIEKAAIKEAVEKVLNLITSSEQYSNVLHFQKGVCIVPSRCQPMTKNLNKTIPYINYRSFTGSDSGFVDIFHAEHLLPDICYRLLESSLLKEYFSFFSASKELTNFHIYYTKNQHTPRSWHVDAPHRKLFIYLTDVQEAHGPYSYQRNTFNLYNNHMSLRGKGIRIVDHKKTFVENFSRPKDADIYTGPSGTCFLTDQRGIHCGQPQEQGHIRLVRVVQVF